MWVILLAIGLLAYVTYLQPNCIQSLPLLGPSSPWCKWPNYGTASGIVVFVAR